MSCCLIHPSLQAHGVPQGLLPLPTTFSLFTPPLPPSASPDPLLHVNTEPNARHVSEPRPWRPRRWEEALKLHSSAPVRRDERRGGIRHTIYHMRGGRRVQNAAQPRWWPLCFLTRTSSSSSSSSLIDLYFLEGKR